MTDRYPTSEATHCQAKFHSKRCSAYLANAFRPQVIEYLCLGFQGVGFRHRCVWIAYGIEYARDGLGESVLVSWQQ